jgi:hypothetical protein
MRRITTNFIKNKNYLVIKFTHLWVETSTIRCFSTTNLLKVSPERDINSNFNLIEEDIDSSSDESISDVNASPSPDPEAAAHRPLSEFSDANLKKVRTMAKDISSNSEMFEREESTDRTQTDWATRAFEADLEKSHRKSVCKEASINENYVYEKYPDELSSVDSSTEYNETSESKSTVTQAKVKDELSEEVQTTNILESIEFSDNNTTLTKRKREEDPESFDQPSATRFKQDSTDITADTEFPDIYESGGE